MRLLHTSDWHLGRSLHRADLGPAQEAFVDHLVEAVNAERVDVVLIAGDVYDRAVPPLESIALFEQALRRLRAAGAAVIAISGNHDSPLRLGVNAGLLDRAGVFLRTRVADCGRPIVLDDRHGRLPVYTVPYLEPDAVRSALGAAVGRSHEAVLGAAMERVRADLAGRDPRRAVLVSHGWVRGGLASDSERDITVGGVGAVPAGLFAGIGWVALGHLHGPQRLADHLAYSGSPLPYSFSEAGHRKGSWLVEMGPGGVSSVDWIPAPVHRALAKVRDELGCLLTAARYAPHEGSFLAVTLTDPVRPPEAMDRLRHRFPHVLTLAWEPPLAATGGQTYAERLHDRNDQEMAEGFVEHVRGVAAAPAERTLLADALTAVRAREAA